MAATTSCAAPRHGLFSPARLVGAGRSRRRQGGFRRVQTAAAVSSEGGRKERRRAPPGVDTRIHWENEDEGWVGGSDDDDGRNKADDIFADNFADLLNDSTDSHYQFLGVEAEADMEEIKAAYRKLSKEYHPDTTSLPIKAASEKFMRVREAYKLLSDPESRRFYDWTLAQRAHAERMRVKLHDPRAQELANYVPVPDIIDRLEGRNLELSDQAMSALTFDVLIIVFAICCTVYVALFREPYL